ncbi:RNA polymerase sigma factor [Nocardioidaceae bacterium]|nr:RNA polymerase sigma factor [Nocardioidaceae bacterium]
MTPDETARLGDLFDAHAPRLLGYARRLVEPADAEDLVSEAFCVAARRLDAVPADPDRARPWLYAVVRKLAANHRRTAGRHRDLWQQLLRETWQPGGHHAAPDAATDAAIAREAAISALGALREGDRELLLLLAWDGLEVAEAAVVLGVRPATLHVRLHRARARLAEAERSLELDHPPPRVQPAPRLATPSISRSHP